MEKEEDELKMSPLKPPFPAKDLILKDTKNWFSSITKGYTIQSRRQRSIWSFGATL
jgi:hypothetical protein